MSRDYSKKHNDDPADAPKPAGDFTEASSPAARERTVPISVVHEEEIEKAKLTIADLVKKAQEIQLVLADPLATKPQHEIIVELQDISKQIHALNARWLAGPGYEYVPPPAPVPQPDVPEQVAPAPVV